MSIDHSTVIKNRVLMNVLFDARKRKSVGKIKASAEVIDFVVKFLSGDLREEGQGRREEEGRGAGEGSGLGQGRGVGEGRGQKGQKQFNGE